MTPNARQSMIFIGMALGLAALFAPAAMPHAMQNRVLVVYNPSDSVPRGWYRIGPAGSLHANSIVLARLPPQAAAVAAQRGYLPWGIPLLKRIGAVAPQSVCEREGVVRIDGVVVATALSQDGKHRPLPSWTRCRILAEGELFLLSDTNAASFDSRYFGPIAPSDVIGSAWPLWTWSTP
jgi:conjugative transfer signal peptidase TraF